MNWKLPINPRSIFFTVAICAFALFFYWGHHPIARHNSYAESAIGYSNRDLGL